MSELKKKLNRRPETNENNDNDPRQDQSSVNMTSPSKVHQ